MSNEKFEEIFGNVQIENINKIQEYINKNYISKLKIEELIYQLEKDEENITKKYKKDKGINGCLYSIDKVRVRAYREKTREINEKLHKLLIETIETRGK